MSVGDEAREFVQKEPAYTGGLEWSDRSVYKSVEQLATHEGITHLS